MLDKSRALDLMISRAERVYVPAPFGANFVAERADDPRMPIGQAEHHGLTNLLGVRSLHPTPVGSAT